MNLWVLILKRLKYYLNGRDVGSTTSIQNGLNKNAQFTKRQPMQEIKLIRELLSNKAVLGRFILDGKEICKTLENPWLNNTPHISCIPEGRYEVVRYSSVKYPDVWELQAVLGRSKILIHNGNLEKHTEGCILVGASWGFLNDEIAVLNSNTTLKKLRGILEDKFMINISSVL